MISREELEQASITAGVPLPNVQKDYVMGWLLWGISQEPQLSRQLALKGGNCLRKVYFPDTRFSDDLDFTAIASVRTPELTLQMEGLLKRVEERSGITFDTTRTRVEAIQTPDPDEQAIDARVYFHGLAGDDNLRLRVKFDISPYEKIVLPLVNAELLHPFTDHGSCATTVQAYSLEEVLAEKLRSWIQRTRARDLFDVAKIIASGRVETRKRDILRVFLEKTIFKSLPAVGRDELLAQEKFATVNSHWIETIICPTAAFIVAARAIDLFTQFINALFQPEVARALASAARGVVPVQVRRIASSIRERIIEAGQSRRLLALTYNGTIRTVEPYSLKFKVRKDGQGFEYFYGYDRTRGQTIKSFFMHEIQGAQVLRDTFIPRDVVEF